MSPPPLILCDDADLAVECARIAGELGLAVAPEVSAGPLVDATQRTAGDRPLAIVVLEPPSPEAMVEVAAAARRSGTHVALAVIGPTGRDRLVLDLARDLGLVAVADLRPLLSAVALLGSGLEEPWRAAGRALPAADRQRLAAALEGHDAGRITRQDAGHLGFADDDSPVVVVGETRDVADALLAIRAASGHPRPPMPTVHGVARESVTDVIFGPPRSLSDPASKAALSTYDVPLPLEELCTSPSRAASEAARIGFPVRIALASPDLRVWDHPDLVADGVDNAARVRDVFRQTMALGSARAPEARLLGVTVSATTPAHAMLRARLSPLPDELVLAELGFADAHGVAADDRLLTPLPTTVDGLDRALRRLRGCALLLDGGAGERRRTVESLHDVLLRLAAFVHDWRREVVAVEIDPIALLVGAGVEVREACVEVGDAFVRSLAATGRTSVG